MFKELRNGIEILVDQADFKLQIKTAKMLCLDQYLKIRLAYLNFDAIFEFRGQLLQYAYIIFQKDVDIF